MQREREEARRKQLEEKKKAEEAAVSFCAHQEHLELTLSKRTDAIPLQLSKLDRETRRKIEEKQRKDAMAKAMPKMKFKSG